MKRKGKEKNELNKHTSEVEKKKEKRKDKERRAHERDARKLANSVEVVVAQ